MDPFTLSLGVQVAGAGLSWWQRRQQADAMREETQETLRRFRAEGERRIGLTRTAAAASGFELGSGSLQTYLSDMETEFARQAGWIQRAGSRAAGASDNAANLGLFADLGGALMGYGRNNNWWRTTDGT